MTDLQDMVDELRRQREFIHPKNNENRAYLEYCVAISSLLWLIRNGMQ